MRYSIPDSIQNMIKICIAIAVVSSLVFSDSAMAKNKTPDTALWQSLLKEHITLSGGVDYQGFQKNMAKLDSFLQSYAAIDPLQMSQNKRKAIYINLYNAFMIKNIITYAKSEKILLSSPKFLEIKINKIDIPGGNIWGGDYKTPLGGMQVNLDDIEHKLIRGVDSGKLKKFNVSKLDPRIHTAVNCAALSCPRVREIAYTEKNIDQLLDENIKEYISSNTHFRMLSASKLEANSIVFWYYSDFDDHAQKELKLDGAGSYLATFLSKETVDLAAKKKVLESDFNDRSKFTLKISSSFSFEYNWKINDTRNQKKAMN